MTISQCLLLLYFIWKKASPNFTSSRNLLRTVQNLQQNIKIFEELDEILRKLTFQVTKISSLQIKLNQFSVKLRIFETSSIFLIISGQLLPKTTARTSFLANVVLVHEKISLLVLRIMCASLNLYWLKGNDWEGIRRIMEKIEKELENVDVMGD